MAETNTIKGVVHKIMDTQQISEKFAKKEIVIKTEGEYPQFIPIQFTNKNIDKLDNITTGSTVIVSYNLRGNEWKEKFYVSIDGWKIEISNLQVATSAKPAETMGNRVKNEPDDLPF